jgi:hypothetical protein
MNESLGRKRLISKLEGMVWREVYNNDSQIRYPITFEGKGRLQGRYILAVNQENESYFFTGKYVFGANELYIYRAINSILEYLKDQGLDTEGLEWELEEEAQ